MSRNISHGRIADKFVFSFVWERQDLIICMQVRGRTLKTEDESKRSTSLAKPRVNEHQRLGRLLQRD